MTDDDHTPSMDEVRYWCANPFTMSPSRVRQRRAEFARFVESERADAWEEGLAASGVAQAFSPDELRCPYRAAAKRATKTGDSDD